MSWLNRLLGKNDGADEPASSARQEAQELLDPYEDRTMIVEGDRAIIVPSKVLERIRAQMERIDLDPQTSWAVEEVMSLDEMAVLFDQLRQGPLVVSETADYARQILSRWSAQLVQHPIPPEAHLEDFITTTMVDPTGEDLGRRIINRTLASSEPIEKHPELGNAGPQDLMGAWIAVLFWFTIKSGLLHEHGDPAPT